MNLLLEANEGRDRKPNFVNFVGVLELLVDGYKQLETESLLYGAG